MKKKFFAAMLTCTLVATSLSPVLAAEETEKSGDVVILFTSDVHGGVDQGFSYAGLYAIRESLEEQGDEVLLADNGDAIQGEPIGTMTKGEAIVDLMNAMKYDVAIPGNHEFDYGMDNFLSLTEKAEFPYLSCNFNHNGENVLDAYTIKEAAGVKIGFVGMTTPKTITSSTPKIFQDESGEFVYGFLQDETGEQLYTAVQEAVDAAREEGADYVVALGHMGNEASCVPWTYGDVISNTSGIDVFLDGHSHDTDQLTVKNKDGEDVIRAACGTKLGGVGWSRISAEGELSAGLYTWDNEESAPELLGIENEIKTALDEAGSKLEETLETVVAKSDVLLTINDPEAQDEEGKPIRMVRRAETNLGDLCADAYRNTLNADIGIVNGGGVRADLAAGDITLGDILRVHPFGNQLCMVEVTGQQILDALEWSARVIPEENGGFLQVSGLSFEVHTYVNSGCTADENGMSTGIEGEERRIRNVKVNDADLEPDKTYTIAGPDYTLLNQGDGYTMFDGATVLKEQVMLDNQVLINYITENLGGTIGEDYADPYGQGRIVIVEEAA